MNEAIITQQDVVDLVQAENIQFPEQPQALSGIDVCQALPVVITLLDGLPVTNPVIKLGISVVVTLLKKYQETNCK